jgi:hypothetical protein
MYRLHMLATQGGVLSTEGQLDLILRDLLGCTPAPPYQVSCPYDRGLTLSAPGLN